MNPFTINPITLKNVFIGFFIFSFYVVSGQTVRKYSNEFMNIGVDAAALGMSNTAVSYSKDVNSVYWNPAGLVDLSHQQVAFMHANYFANIAQYDFAAYAAPIDAKSAWGASVVRFGVDNILNTTQLIDNQGNIDYNRVSLFSAADYGVTFSYARKTEIKNLQYGVNTKVIRRIIGDFATSWGFGLDLGLQYQIKKWNLGLMVRDITTTYNTWQINETKYNEIKNAVSGQNQDLPERTEITLSKVQLGFSRKFDLKHDLKLQTAASFNMQFAKTNDIYSSEKLSINPAAGFELGYHNVVFIRTGVGNFQNTLQIDNTKKVGFQPNIGLGFQYKGIHVDYALTDIGDQSAALYSNIFSFMVDFSVFK